MQRSQKNNKAKKTTEPSPKDELAPPRRPRLDDAELKRRAIERWENEGGRPLPR